MDEHPWGADRPESPLPSPLLEKDDSPIAIGEASAPCSRSQESSPSSPPKSVHGDASALELISAADAGKADVVVQLIEGNANPDAHSTDGETALHRAAYWANKEVVEVLLNA